MKKGVHRMYKRINKLITLLLSVAIIGTAVPYDTFAGESKELKEAYFDAEGKLTAEGEAAVDELSKRVTIVDEERYQEIEKLLLELDKVNARLNNSGLESREVNSLNEKQRAIQAKLESLGVSNKRTEFNFVTKSDDCETYTAIPGYNYDSRFRVNSYYQDVLLDGKNYRMYTELVTDSGFNKLAYQDSEKIQISGEVTNKAKWDQLWSSSIKFVASTVAGELLPSALSIPISIILDALPGIKDELIIYNPDKEFILNINNFSIYECVKYVYFYDETKDKWLLCFAANRFDLAYFLYINYNNGNSHYVESKPFETTAFLDYNKYSMNFIISYALIMEDGFPGYPLDCIYSKVNMEVYRNENTPYIKTFLLHGKPHPYELVYY